MKTKNLLTLALFSTCFTGIFAQEGNKKQDIAAIMDMCGCYEVEFKYAETFAPDIAYEKAYNYTAKALELAIPIVEEDDFISIQHLLVVNDTMIIKHWRQDWEFEDGGRYEYIADSKWNYVDNEDVDGTWTQRVYHVDDSPRYSGTATWVHVDGKSFWEDDADSPLPRREYSKRSDYNVMVRGNRVEITDFGWIHEQDNDKIIRAEGKEDVLLAQEKGMNTYTKVADEKCQAAQKWWENNKDLWAKVRKKWDKVFEKEEDIQLKKKVDGKPAYLQLFMMKPGTSQKEINETIDNYTVENTL
jgi:hypothetical protein